MKLKTGTKIAGELLILLICDIDAFIDLHKKIIYYRDFNISTRDTVIVISNWKHEETVEWNFRSRVTIENCSLLL